MDPWCGADRSADGDLHIPRRSAGVSDLPRDHHADPESGGVRALGIDPGLVVTGYGVLEQEGKRIRLIEAGTIDSGTPKDPLPVRLRRLYEDLCGLIEEQRPEVAALEQLYSHYEHPRTAILM